MPAVNGSISNQRGATIVVVGLLLTILLGISALAIDVGYLYASRNQLQNSADAAALAAARKLGEIYQGKSDAEQAEYVCTDAEKGQIIAVAQEIASKNKAAGDSVYLNETDIVIGRYDQWRNLPTGSPRNENVNQPDAVRVIARRDDSVSNGHIATFFARALGIPTVSLSATATAALSGMATAEPGEFELPVGISSTLFQQGGYCGKQIKFYPADSCAGWTGFDQNPNTSNMRDILDGKVSSPEVIAGVTKFDFTGGVAATLFDNMYDLFHQKAVWVDVDGNPGTAENGKLVWSTSVVVYQNSRDSVVNGTANCSNPSGDYTIVGFARINIDQVLTTPEKTLQGSLTCNAVDQQESRGGGTYYGVKASIPGLVE